jgi:catechol 2,3-dioxygenase-like lactoylglutathione lyase family enzyme
MSTITPNGTVLELRVALTASDYERLVQFYCDGLGIKPAAIWENDGGQALMLEMGQATLEIFDEAQAEAVDRIEAGKRASGRVRFALHTCPGGRCQGVPDLKSALERLLAKGATLVHEPVVTPWGDTTVRLQDPDGMQITLFQVPEDGNPGQ